MRGLASIRQAVPVLLAALAGFKICELLLATDISAVSIQVKGDLATCVCSELTGFADAVRMDNTYPRAVSTSYMMGRLSR